MNQMEKTRPVIEEAMRIGGKKVKTDETFNVHYPYTDEVIGTVPAGRAEHAREAFDIAANFTPKLTRYERQQILFKAGELLRERRDHMAEVLTLELGISTKDALYEAGRAYDVFTLAGQLCIRDDGEIFSCDLTPHGKARKIYTIARTAEGDLGHHAFQPSHQHGCPQDRAGSCYKQLYGLQANRADAAVRHRAC